MFFEKSNDSRSIGLLVWLPFLPQQWKWKMGCLQYTVSVLVSFHLEIFSTSMIMEERVKFSQPCRVSLPLHVVLVVPPMRRHRSDRRLPLRFHRRRWNLQVDPNRSATRSLAPATFQTGIWSSEAQGTSKNAKMHGHECCSPSSHIVFKIFKLSLHVPMRIETVLFLNPAPSAFAILFRCGAFHQHLSSNKQRCFCWCPCLFHQKSRDSKKSYSDHSGQQKIAARKTHQPFSSFFSNPFTCNHKIF